MEDYTPTTLKIVTTLNKAIDVFPLTQFQNGYARNSFMIKFDTEFRSPEPHKATFSRKGYAPTEAWFSLFSESEKEVMEDDIAFYGVMYQTTIKLAIERLEKLREKMMASHKAKADTNTVEQNQRFHNYLEELWEAYEGLEKFNETDEITMIFLFPEWPNAEVAKKTKYIKEVEAKLLGMKQKRPLPL